MDANAIIISNNDDVDKRDPLVSWVMDRCDSWRDYRKSLFQDKWEEYNRIWRGWWVPEDRQRASEKSRLISPATQQAVESTVSELEEAVFGRGVWFDIRDDVEDQQKQDMEALRMLLQEDLEKEGVKEAISEILLISAIYGTGIGEILIEEKEDYTPMQQSVPGTSVSMIGTGKKTYTCVKVNPVIPVNFLIDPAARTINEALGVAIEEVVPRHAILRGIKQGIYNDVEIGTYPNDSELEIEEDSYFRREDDQAKLLKYYGLVPKHLLEDKEVNLEDNNEEYVEAIVVVVNDSIVLKATETPYMMKDRPVVAFQLDRIPGKFWGRGVVEKGYNAQKALDAELRARMDGLALTTHPLMGLDATRLPRGAKFKVEPGATILTNGNPKDILFPFNFGQVGSVTFRESAEFERMIQNATGAMDGATPVGINPRNSTASGMSMMMAASMKRQKRTLSNFQSSFLIPLINKAAWRFMQFNPDRYKVGDWKFVPSSTMGIMAREYEQQQFIQLLSMTEPKSPAYYIILNSIIDNSSMTNREEIKAALQQAQQPSPEQQQAMQAQMMLGMQQAQAQIELIKAQIEQIKGNLQIDAAELQLKAAELNRPEPKPEPVKVDPFEKQAKIAELALREKEIDTKVTLETLRMNKEAEVESKKQQNNEEFTKTKQIVDSVSKSVDSIVTKISELEKANNESIEVEPIRNSDGKLIGVKKGNKVVKLKGVK